MAAAFVFALCQVPEENVCCGVTYFGKHLEGKLGGGVDAGFVSSGFFYKDADCGAAFQSVATIQSDLGRGEVADFVDEDS